MRTIRTKIYKFEELSKESQANAIDEMRGINTEHDDWYDCIFEDFKETLTEAGFLDATIQFSGFWSQGDGLSFDAKIDASKFATITNEKRVVNLINSCIIDEFTIEKTSFANHYSHEKTRYVDYSICNGENCNKVLETLCEKIEAKRLELCKDFYSTLEKDYYYLQSDELIKETILSNEYEFLKSGKQF
jgi:RNA binding exosome subunit